MYIFVRIAVMDITNPYIYISGNRKHVLKVKQCTINFFKVEQNKTGKMDGYLLFTYILLKCKSKE